MKTTAGIRLGRLGRLPQAGDWDFDGSCVNWSNAETVSVAAFQWIAKNRGRGVKRSKSAKRFVGSPYDRESIFARAEDFCRKQEAQAFTNS